MRGHLTPREAGEHASAAGVKRRAAHAHVRRARRAGRAKQAAGGLRRPGRGRPRGRRLRGLTRRRGARRPTLGRMARSRDLFANFERMRREIDELFGDVFDARPGCAGAGFSPPVDVYYADDPPRAVVKADLAGIDIEDVALEIRGPPAGRSPASAARRGRGPRLPADRDRARAVPARDRARRRRGRRRGARHLRGRDPAGRDPARRPRHAARASGRRSKSGELESSIHIPSTRRRGRAGRRARRALPEALPVLPLREGRRSRTRSRRWPSARSARCSSSTTCSAATACS